MHSRLLVSVLVLALVASAGVGAVDHGEPAIVELYPNPVTTGDTGEFVTIRLPPGADLSNYELVDEDQPIPLSPDGGNVTNRDTSTVTFSTHPNITERVTGRTVYPLSDRIQLANSGDSLRLRRNGTPVDEVEYGRAPETSVYDVSRETWEPLGATDIPVVSHRGGTVDAFVLPDQAQRVTSFLENAENRILLAGYTVADPTVVQALLDAHGRGLGVEVLVEGSPVGGLESHEAAALDRLSSAGISVRVIGGQRARYRFHHPKYAVVDDSALVTTENWKRAGTGGRSSRGWGVVTDGDRIVEGLVEVFRADRNWVDSIAWEDYESVQTVDGDHASGEYPEEFATETLPVDRTQLVVAPDNAERVLLETIAGARETIDVKQAHLSSRDFPLLEAVIDAARRGVRVRILLSGQWYAVEENRRIQSYLEDRAATESLPLSVRIADPNGAFEKIHAKGLLVDGNTTYVGSVNWNNNSLRRNREVGLVVESEAVGGYFQRVFDHDWEGDAGQKIPLGYVAVGVFAGLLAVLAARKLEFEP